jgi:heme O synthase-like polyprenyltransferase
MLANENPDHAATQALIHSALMFPLCWSLPFLNVAPWWFAALSTPVNYHYLLKPSIAFKKDVTYDKATKLFFNSLAHLSVLFLTSVAAICWKRSVKTLIVESSFWKKVTGFFSKLFV